MPAEASVEEHDIEPVTSEDDVGDTVLGVGISMHAPGAMNMMPLKMVSLLVLHTMCFWPASAGAPGGLSYCCGYGVEGVVWLVGVADYG